MHIIYHLGGATAHNDDLYAAMNRAGGNEEDQDNYLYCIEGEKKKISIPEIYCIQG
jgi:hypothetical protein